MKAAHIWSVELDSLSPVRWDSTSLPEWVECVMGYSDGRPITVALLAQLEPGYRLVVHAEKAPEVLVDALEDASG